MICALIQSKKILGHLNDVFFFKKFVDFNDLIFIIIIVCFIEQGGIINAIKYDTF